MPDWLAIILLGIIEGVTEFLPISSTGHLLIPQNLGWLPAKSDLFNVVIQSGAVLAVLAVFTQRVKQLATTLGDPATRITSRSLLVSFFITAVGGLVIKKLDIELPETIPPVAWATLIGGVIILVLEFLHKGKTGVPDITWTVVIAGGAGAIARGGVSRHLTLRCQHPDGDGLWSRPACGHGVFVFARHSHTDGRRGFKILSAIKDGEAGNETGHGGARHAGVRPFGLHRGEMAHPLRAEPHVQRLRLVSHRARWCADRLGYHRRRTLN
jgi:hypothetical protein